MKKFIFIERNGIYIIDLQKTLKALQDARALLEGVARRSGTVLFVGTKRQAKDAIQEEAERCGMPFVNERWLGGMLTNFKTIKSNIRRFKEIDKMDAEGILEKLSKKEQAQINKERVRLVKIFTGIKEMNQLPAAVFVIDTKKDGSRWPRPTGSASPWSAWSIRTAIRRSSTTRFPGTTTRSARSGSSAGSSRRRS